MHGTPLLMTDPPSDKQAECHTALSSETLELQGTTHSYISMAHSVAACPIARMQHGLGVVRRSLLQASSANGPPATQMHRGGHGEVGSPTYRFTRTNPVLLAADDALPGVTTGNRVRKKKPSDEHGVRVPTSPCRAARPPHSTGCMRGDAPDPGKPLASGHRLRGAYNRDVPAREFRDIRVARHSERCTVFHQMVPVALATEEQGIVS